MKNSLRYLVLAIIVTSALLAWSHDGRDNPEAAVRAAIQQFEDGLNKRDLSKIEAVVAEDLVVLENGHRNDGWADFRDNHLVPEMKEPAAPSKTEVIRVKATPEMAWGYTRTEMPVTRKSGEKATLLLWSTYIVEKRAGKWKIVLLDWSIRQMKANE